MKRKVVTALMCTAALGSMMAMSASAEGKLIGYTCMDGTNPFFVALQGAIEEVVEENGDELVAMDPANDSNKQIDQIEDLISRGIELMFVNPVDADGIIPGLDMLKEAEIPMFGFDTQVGDMSYLVSYAGSDNYNAGYVCGEDLAKKLPDGGDILVLDSPTMQSVTDRTNGFMDAIKESGVEFNVVGQQDAQGNQQPGRNGGRQQPDHQHANQTANDHNALQGDVDDAGMLGEHAAQGYQHQHNRIHQGVFQ